MGLFPWGQQLGHGTEHPLPFSTKAENWLSYTLPPSEPALAFLSDLSLYTAFTQDIFPSGKYHIR